MKYDDASWHYGGDFPVGLPPEAGATHIAMFVAWAVLSGLAGEFHLVDGSLDLDRLRKRELTPVQWFLQACDEKFTDEDLNDEGNAFAAGYYIGDGLYLDDYSAAFPAAESSYHVEDGWASFDTLAPRLTQRLVTWRGA